MEIYLKDYIEENDVQYFILDVHHIDYIWQVKKRYSQLLSINNLLGNSKFKMNKWLTNNRLEEVKNFILHLQGFVHNEQISKFFLEDIIVNSVEDFNKIISLRRTQFVLNAIKKNTKIDKNELNYLEIELTKYKSKYTEIFPKLKTLLDKNQEYESLINRLETDLEKYKNENILLQKNYQKMVESTNDYLDTIKLYQDNINFFIDQIRDYEKIIHQLKNNPKSSKDPS